MSSPTLTNFLGGSPATVALRLIVVSFIVGIVLGLFGFASSSSGMAATQTPTAVFGIGFTYVGINMLIYLSSILILRQFAKIGTPAPGSRLA